VTPAPRSDSRVAATLATLAGITDVTSWILLGGLFTAHITGNLVVLAANLVTGTPPRLVAVLALPVFIVAAVAATAFTRAWGAQRRERTRTALLGAQASLLLVAAGLSFATTASANPDAPLAVLIGLCAVAAMATQNAYLHLVPERAPSTAVMTGNLVTATIAAYDLVTTRRMSPAARAQWSSSWPLLAGFIVGCLTGAAASTVLGDHAAVVPALVATIIFVAVTVPRRAAASARYGEVRQPTASAPHAQPPQPPQPPQRQE
jgi:uncharacterized membrane protein YoaK (UPF0700 family)